MSLFLPPPYIEETLPAQFQTSTRGIVVPFILNRAVGDSDFDQIVIKIKTASTNKEIGYLRTKEKPIRKNDIYYANFMLNDPEDQSKNIKLTYKQFYKIQIAFSRYNREKENYDDGAFSTPAIFKYTIEPIIKILDINQNELKDSEVYDSKTFLGALIEQPEDDSEKIEQYKFEVFDENEELFDSTGYQFHDSANSKRTIGVNGKIASIDTYNIKKDLAPAAIYFIRYTVKTTSGMTLSSKFYRFSENDGMSLDFPGYLEIQEAPDDGYFSLRTTFNQDRLFNGSFRLLRTDERSDFKVWEKLKDIYFDMKDINNKQAYEIFKDFSVEQGIKYKYALQQFFRPDIINESTELKSFQKNLFTYQMCPDGKRKVKDTFMLNFEDMFLSDGDRQLKIRFNPKVTSFKNHILENKVDTIGGKYPFVFRNGRVLYKEFPISGLITCQMDENQFFMFHNDIDTNLTYENIAEERKFKQEVIDWLSNGKPKLFRSPAEGNYIITLMKVSFKPNDKLGRMLHTFSASACEVMEYNYENLFHNNFLVGKLGTLLNEKINTLPGFVVKTKTLNSKKSSMNIPNAIYARILNVTNTMQMVKITYGPEEKSETIAIGYNKYYYINAGKDSPITQISLAGKLRNDKANTLFEDTITFEYGYYSNNKFKDTAFDSDNAKIRNFKTYGKAAQFIGEKEKKNIFDAIIHPPYANKYKRYQIESIPVLAIKAKSIKRVWYDENHALAYDKLDKAEQQKQKRDLIYDHKVYLLDNQTTGTKPNQKDCLPILNTFIYYAYNTNKYYIKNLKTQYLEEVSNIDYHYFLSYIHNDKVFSENFILKEKFISFQLTELDQLNDLSIGNGLYIDMYYILTEYRIEEMEDWML